MGVVDYESQGDIGASQLPKRYDIEVYQGDAFDFSLSFLSEGLPADVTDWEGLCQIKSSSNALLGAAVVSVLGDPADGVLRVLFDDVTDIETGNHKYDVQVTDASGRPRTVIGGKFVVTEDISE